MLSSFMIPKAMNVKEIKFIVSELMHPQKPMTYWEVLTEYNRMNLPQAPTMETMLHTDEQLVSYTCMSMPPSAKHEL